jgi:hypothetical protein
VTRLKENAMALDTNKLQALMTKKGAGPRAAFTDEELTDVGLTPQQIKSVRDFRATSGLTFSGILQLLIKYGPTLLNIIEDITAMVSGGGTPQPAP